MAHTSFVTFQLILMYMIAYNLITGTKVRCSMSFSYKVYIVCNSLFTSLQFCFLRYFVLLMLTDGIISDMAQTKEAIVTVRVLSLSFNSQMRFIKETMFFTICVNHI